MNLKEFDKLTKRDFENRAIMEEIRRIFKDHERAIILLSRVVGEGSNIAFWAEVDEFLKMNVSVMKGTK